MSFSRLMRSKVFLLLVAWRVSSVFVVQTAHVPDEYWQSLEVAHKLAFDYGYLTWEWRIGIRSYLYPFLISIFYSIVKFLQVDSVFVIVTLPRVFQALLTAYAEYRFYVWTGSKFALFNLCINWYWYYCASRTLINSFETCLTIIALSEYPWNNNPRKSSKFMWTVGFLCCARPTAAVVWLPLCLHHLSKSKSLFVQYSLVGIVCLSISTALDAMCYGRFILTPWEFFKVNVLNSISEQYGTMPLSWYLISGLPVVLGINYLLVPFAIFRMYKNDALLHRSAVLAFTALWSIGIYSSLAHKEFRFILPVLPMLIYVIHETLLSDRIGDFKRKLFIFLLIVSNVLPGIYFSVIHQKGRLEVMQHLGSDMKTMNSSEVDILFLTTCHTTPYYSHLHENVSMRFLTCEPNLVGQKDYYDETDEFFMDPMEWLEVNYLSRDSIDLPSHVIVYDTMVEHIKPFLNSYKQIISCPDAHFSQHGNFDALIIYRHRCFM